MRHSVYSLMYLIASDLDTSFSAIDFSPSLKYPSFPLSFILHLCLINIIFDSFKSSNSACVSTIFSLKNLWGLFNKWEAFLYRYSDFWVYILANILVLSSYIFYKLIALRIFILSYNLFVRDYCYLYLDLILFRDLDIFRDLVKWDLYIGWV